MSTVHKLSGSAAAICVCIAGRLAAAESPSPSPSPSPPELSLVSLFAGAYVVKRPKEWMDDESAFHMLDEKPSTRWATPRGDISPQTIVIGLPERTVLKTLEFDNSHIDTQFTGCSAKDVVVEMSDTSADAGFKKIAEASLQDRQDHQRFAVSAEVPGRWVRLTVKNNHNPADKDNTIELSEFRAFGTQLTQSAMPNISGTYETYFTGKLRLKQEGISVSGCYEARQGQIDGGIEGRAFKFTYYEEVAGGKKELGVGVMVFSPDGKQLFSLWDEFGGRERLILGSKESEEVGMCPEWAKLMKELAAAEVPVTTASVPESSASPLVESSAAAATPEATAAQSATPAAPQTPSPTAEQSASATPAAQRAETESRSATPSATATPSVAPIATAQPQQPAPVTIAQAQLASDLVEFGRARVYGINFDSDSDRIKDESKPTLDNLVGILRRKAQWKMSIEGHTDSTSTPQHNQELSERRAAAVKNYLVAAGIDAARLTTAGFGQERPIASNDNPLGKAQNRRVELVRQ